MRVYVCVTPLLWTWNIRLKERLVCGDQPINLFDEACTEHDKIYKEHTNDMTKYGTPQTIYLQNKLANASSLEMLLCGKEQQL